MPAATLPTFRFAARNALAAAFALAAILWTFTGRSQAPNADKEDGFGEIVIPTVSAAWDLFYDGNYEAALEMALLGVELDSMERQWEIIASRSLLAKGEYTAALERLQAYAKRWQTDLRGRLLLRKAALFSDEPKIAEEQLESISYFINYQSRRYLKPDDIVAIGEAALLLGVEPKIVLENFYKRMQDEPDPPVSAFLAAGELALRKNDFALASRHFQTGLREYPDNPDLLWGVARSFKESDRSKLGEYIALALERNPNHLKSLLLLAENSIAGEAYDDAELVLAQALTVNPRHPNALALKAVLAYLDNRAEAGDDYRDQALSTWKQNPEVDYLIGRELSRKYRFKAGAVAQRSALLFDPDYLPAKIQLAQDLLRLGQEDEAWQHVHHVHEEDPYDIAAYNLVTLHDRLDDFTTLESENFILKLSQEEAPVYGQRALQVLEMAHARLTKRYGLELPRRTQVEIYQDPADFETRTFGVPGNPGFLGVCFGPVFTINSPATRSHNWEAVLYHEFCHTITLTLTNNRMPRWLSEGLSVYEEEEYNPSWGQRMTIDYRGRILSGAMQPIDQMSAAFLQASSGDDIQFAYYQSYLIVRYMFETYGSAAVLDVLQALGNGTAINEALALHLAPMESLNEAFDAFAKEEALGMASDFRFESANGLPWQILDTENEPEKDYFEELKRAKELLAEEDWAAAAERLERLVEGTKYLPGEENAHAALARAYRESAQRQKEIDTLQTIVANDAHQLAPVTRLLEIARERDDSEAAFRWSRAWLAINPMSESAWRALLGAARELERREVTLEAASALVSLQPPDLATLHYEIARNVLNSDLDTARRHTLMALEIAPRFREAYELLLRIRSASARDVDRPLGIDAASELIRMGGMK